MSVNLEELAIQAATQQDWKQAVSLNQQILSSQADNIQAINRLARAFSELGHSHKAKTQYRLALKLDPFNPIATKNLQKLKLSSNPKNHSSNNHSSASTISPSTFIEEPCKTSTVNLTRLTSANYLAQLAPGDILDIHRHGNRLALKHQQRIIGYLPDKLGFHLCKLIKTGNRYSFTVKAVNHQLVTVFIREAFQSKRNQHLLSFPAKPSPSPGSFYSSA